jgi:hypothetical protein
VLVQLKRRDGSLWARQHWFEMEVSGVAGRHAQGGQGCQTCVQLLHGEGWHYFLDP